MSRSGYVFTSRGVSPDIIVGCLVRNRAFGSRIAMVMGEWEDHWILNTYANTSYEWDTELNERNAAHYRALRILPTPYTFWNKVFYEWKPNVVTGEYERSITGRQRVIMGGMHPFVVHKLGSHMWQPVRQVKGPATVKYNPDEALM